MPVLLRSTPRSRRSAALGRAPGEGRAPRQARHLPATNETTATTCTRGRVLCTPGQAQVVGGPSCLSAGAPLWTGHFPHPAARARTPPGTPPWPASCRSHLCRSRTRQSPGTHPSWPCSCCSASAQAAAALRSSGSASSACAKAAATAAAAAEAQLQRAEPAHVRQPGRRPAAEAQPRARHRQQHAAHRARQLEERGLSAGRAAVRLLRQPQLGAPAAAAAGRRA